MKFEFKLNGTTQLTIIPETNLERELAKDLFSGNVKVSVVNPVDPKGEVLIEKAPKSMAVGIAGALESAEA